MSGTTNTQPKEPPRLTGVTGRSGGSGMGRWVAPVICGLLAVEFLIGMYMNLYVNLPQIANNSREFGGSMMGRFGMMFSPDQPLLMVHMMLGMFLVVIGVVVLVVAAHSRDRFSIGWSATGLAALVIAGYGGISFFMFGHSDGDSYLMAVGFLVSFAAYLAGAIRNSVSGPLLW